MTAVGWLPADVGELFGTEATAEESYDVLTVDVPPASWISALETARDRLGCTYFDWLSAVDEPGTGFRVAAHVVALGPVRRLLLRTTVPHEAPVLPTAVAVYAGAAWHERETHEMFGVAFEDHPALEHLLLPEGFEGHPLRKDFVLAARVAKAWPGAKEPGESDHGGPRRRQMLPPGVPDPNEWGPLKGQLPPAPARPARGAGRAAGERPARAAGERPARRARTAAEGSVGQTAPGTEPPATPRRTRTAAEGSASQTSPGGQDSPAAPPPAAPAPRRSRSASQGSASQRASGPADEPTAESDAGQQQGVADSGAPAGRPDVSGGGPSDHVGSGPTPRGDDDTAPSSPAGEPAPEPTPSTPRGMDAPWHHARPAFDEPAETGPGSEPGPSEEPDAPKDRAVPDEPDAPAEPDVSAGPDAPQESDTSDETDTPRKPPNSPGGPQ
ncbi:NADH-quinone oxidoreductase subunit C [Streptomyces sp. AC512_CC834]|uniref:NADH-quinone oxidoreductase subunit C n=1 Tax=Streptomyces sp. AC512_CC834 TaxID=2823691 RepID=UPI001C256DCB|nr:NADH-quinone oxidoreductase subunit C [Streptomyces sp. AC512_CC834]